MQFRYSIQEMTSGYARTMDFHYENYDGDLTAALYPILNDLILDVRSIIRTHHQ